jgi:hypothetical protein
MSKRRRLPVLVVIVALLAATGVALSVTHPKNPSGSPSGLSVTIDTESSALYCTGLSNGPGAPGRVDFYNTASGPRNLSVSVVSSLGTTWSGALELGAHQGQFIEPSVLDASTKNATYGVAVQISGGGVVGEEVEGGDRAEAPCVNQGATRWYATGFDTLVGSSADLSVYNPTATAAVLNASIYGATGVSAPQSFQGISVPAHTQSTIDLGTEVVNTQNIGVAVHVLRGSLEIVGVQDSNGSISLNPGQRRASADVSLPDVTTVLDATAQLRLANPSDQPANVSVAVSLGEYKIPDQRVTLSPFSTGAITITPNPAIPASGYAALTLHSSVPIVTTLATGSGSVVLLSSPSAPVGAVFVRDFTSLGFDAATITNTSAHTVRLTVTTFNSASPKTVTVAGGIKLRGGATANLSTLFSSFDSPGGAYLLRASSPSVVVSLTLPSRPRGIDVVSPLDGR